MYGSNNSPTAIEFKGERVMDKKQIADATERIPVVQADRSL